WRLHPDGVAVERGGLPDFWIPRASITGIRRDSRLAGKVTGTDVLLVITWRLGDVELDTGFRGDDLDDYPLWIEKLSDHDIKGGAQ
ncbi:transporter, partial [Amycolatopsis sp. NPDC000673]